MVISLRSFKNNNAYWILVGAIIFGLVLTLMNFFLYDVVVGRESFEQVEVDDKTFQDDDDGTFGDGDWLGWFGDRWEDITSGFTGAFSLFSLDLEILEPLGYIGVLIRTAYGFILFVGVVDILWIG